MQTSGIGSQDQLNSSLNFTPGVKFIALIVLCTVTYFMHPLCHYFHMLCTAAILFYPFYNAALLKKPTFMYRNSMLFEYLTIGHEENVYR